MKTNKTKIQSGGYNIFWLLPLHATVSGLILFLTPFIGLMLASSVVLVPFIYILTKLAPYTPRLVGFDYTALKQAEDRALRDGTKEPHLFDFAIYEKKLNPLPQKSRFLRRKLISSARILRIQTAPKEHSSIDI